MYDLVHDVGPPFFEVGRLVGRFDGFLVGFPDGFMVGFFDGLNVGRLLGFFVGFAVVAMVVHARQSLSPGKILQFVLSNVRPVRNPTALVQEVIALTVTPLFVAIRLQ